MTASSSLQWKMRDAGVMNENPGFWLGSGKLVDFSCNCSERFIIELSLSKHLKFMNEIMKFLSVRMTKQKTRKKESAGYT